MAEDEFEDQDETEEEEETEDETEGESDKPVKSDKRVADLISARDKETARANAAEKALAAIRGKDKDGADNPERAALVQEIRDSALDSIYASNPKLTDYGIDRVLIEGSTRAEVRASADQLVALIEQVETRVTNATLAKHGIQAAPLGGKRSKPVNYSDMSKEDFEKAIHAAKTGGNPAW